MNRNHHFSSNAFEKTKNFYSYNRNLQFFHKPLFLSNNNNFNNNNNNYLLPKQTNVPVSDPLHHTEKVLKRQNHTHFRLIKAKKSSSNNNNRKIPQKESKDDPLPIPQWCKEDALKAIEIEQAYNRMQQSQYVLKFPDPVIDKSIIHGFSSGIVNVRVQQPITPRYVYIQLHPDEDPEKLQHEISCIPFGSGMLTLEKHHIPVSEHPKPEDIDPYTIFLGNIHPSTTIKSIKEKVPKSYRVDVCNTKKHKFGRHAFAKFRLASDARDAFMVLNHMTHDTDNGMDLIVRFRRVKGRFSMKGESREEKSMEVIDLTEDENPFVTNLEGIDRVVTDLLNNESLDFEKLRQMEASRYESMKNVPIIKDFIENFSVTFQNRPGITDDALDDTFEQMDANIPCQLDDSLDFDSFLH